MAQRVYVTLTEQEQHDIIVEFHSAQERDHYCHSLNHERYIALLRDLPPGSFRTRIEELKAETEARLTEVEAILQKTETQLPPSADLQAAIQRVKAPKA